MSQGEFNPEFVCHSGRPGSSVRTAEEWEGIDTKYSPLGTASVRTDNNAVLPPRNIPLDVRNHQWFRPKVIHRNIEEALNLARVKIHRDYMITSRNYEHVGDQLGRNRRPRLVLFIHASVGETWDDSSDPACRCSFTCRDENEEFHEIIIDISTAGLDDEDVFVTDRLGNFDVSFAIGEFFDCDGNERDVQPDIVRESQVDGR